MVNNLDVSAVPFAIGINWTEMDAPARKTLSLSIVATEITAEGLLLCRRRHPRHK